MTISSKPLAEDLTELVPFMSPEDQQYILDVVSDKRFIWSPLEGPQTLAYETQADIIGYGGAAGGGKTDLACGKALTQHSKTMILRREATQLPAIVDRIQDILGSRDGLNSQVGIWRLGDGKQIEFGSVPHLGDERKYQGRPHDLLVFDEAANFLEAQVRFLLGWLRTVDPNQKCQALLAFNPPTSTEGRWIIQFFAPWLDKDHTNPAQPGELRWFATVGEEEQEVPDSRAFVIVGKEFVYDFDPDEVSEPDIVRPMSRTFIPSRIADNPYLLGTGYMHQLQALPEPLRSQMLLGDFHAGMEDDPYQVIPTKWAEDAMRRWKPKDIKPPMDSLGVDVARGGKDKTVIARRHGNWIDKLLAYEGSETPDGPAVAGLVVSATRNRAVQHVEINGVGASPVDFLAEANQHVIGVDVSRSSLSTDKSGRLRMANVRTALWWAMREALDPSNNVGLALPPSKRLLLDLTAPLWALSGDKIRVESRDAIIARTGKSPDYATAVMLCILDTPKATDIQDMMLNRPKNIDPIDEALAGVRESGGKGYDPYQSI